MAGCELFDVQNQKIMLNLWHSHFGGEDKRMSIKQAATCMAQNLGARKAYSTLARELNPDDDGAKLGALTLFMLMLTTGDHTPLKDWAEKLGYYLVPQGDEPPTTLSVREQRALVRLAGAVSCKKCPAYSGCALKYEDTSTYNAGDCVSEILKSIEGA